MSFSKYKRDYKAKIKKKNDKHRRKFGAKPYNKKTKTTELFSFRLLLLNYFKSLFKKKEHDF